jgi:hypothetical protein
MCPVGLLAAAVTAAPPLESLPVPAHDIPSLSPPLGHARSDVHGWLWLPIDGGAKATKASAVTELKGWWYHHTPEFWNYSCHNFEIMVAATLTLDHPVVGLPLPPATERLSTEYVFTPPAFSLDELITGEALSFYGHFTNGSFDTKQYYILSNGTIKVEEVTTVHYLWDDQHTAVSPMLQQAYLSYPRAVQPTTGASSPAGLKHAFQPVNDTTDGGLSAGPATAAVHHLYWLHVLRRAPDYDQVVHVTVDAASCLWQHGDSVADVAAAGATFGTTLANDVQHRLFAGTHAVTLFTERSRGSKTKTTCNATAVEEVHCVVMPDSFAKCPPRTSAASQPVSGAGAGYVQDAA